jgi:prepilin-type N-terminal cleavage/methylation domain-containing protein
MTPRSPSPSCRRGFTLVEATMASLIVAVMLTAAMSIAGSAGLAQYKTAEQATASALADAMIAEITAQAYVDPGASPVFGPETGEAGGDRSDYDDVDDYNGLSETAPARRDAVAIPGLTGWERSVSINYVVRTALDTVSGSDTGVKCIVITVKHTSAVVLTRRALRSSAL